MTKTIDLATHTSGLFVLYLIIAGNYIGELFQCNFQRIIQNNVFVKHIIAFGTLFFFVTFASSEMAKEPMYVQILMSIALYAWFMLTCSCNEYALMLVLLLLFVVYAIQTQITFLKDEDEDKHKDKISKLRVAQTVINGVAMALTLFGVWLYFCRQKAEHGKNFSWKTFFKGHADCGDNNFISVEQRARAPPGCSFFESWWSTGAGIEQGPANRPSDKIDAKLPFAPPLATPTKKAPRVVPRAL